MSYRWWSSCRTTAGRRRRVNEDAYLSLDEVGLWLVADGMGGHARGDVASRMVVEAFEGLTRPRSLEDFGIEVRQRLVRANRRVREEMRRAGDNQVMGSTVVAFFVYKREWMCLWAGDSRAYLLRDGRLEQLTHDHSIVQEMVDRGELKRDEALKHPASNQITRAVGAQEELHLDAFRSTLRDGDAVLLCTDGLIREVDDAEVTTILDDCDCAEASEELIELTLERGARDNVTAAVIRFESTTGAGDMLPDDTAINYALRGRQASGAELAV